MEPARTRFAPSPTGFLHVGGVRTALYNYLLAKKTNGQFLLRLEDTDRERYVPEGVGQIVEALDWLGLKPDEGFWITEGQHQNVDYIQSERHQRGFYQKYADKLVEAGLAYYSPTTPEELEKLKEQARKESKPFLYRREIDDRNTQNKLEHAPIRLDTKAFFKSDIPSRYTVFFLAHFIRTGSKETPEFEIRWTTEKGESESWWNSRVIEDFVLIKADGFPTYNFANVVDDHDMGITHVMRGDEFIASTAKHVMLYAALGIPESKIPIFVHLPVINGEDGKKLSKRTGDTNALDYRDKGYLPEALLNFLALLGWNDGTEQEIFTPDELVQKFSLERINSSPAVFDIKRLNWMNGHYIRQIPLDDLYAKVANFWPAEAKDYNDDYKKKVLGLVQERLKFFAELPELTTFFFKDLPVDAKLWQEHKQLKKLGGGELKKLLEQSKAVLEQSDFSAEDLTEKLNTLLDTLQQKPAVLFSLIRIATTQAPASPGLAETLAVLGKDVSLRRISAMLTELS